MVKVFISYRRDDDRYSGGKISAFRQRLSETFGFVTGRELEVFQDRTSIGWGQHWPETLDQALGEATFLIPILTPRFFMSAHCRGELSKFLEHERRLGRCDLVLPVYWMTCPVLEAPEQRQADELASALHERQHRDWRDLRFHDFTDRPVIEALEAMAMDIDCAFYRKRTAHAPGPAPAGATENAAPQAGEAVGQAAKPEPTHPSSPKLPEEQEEISPPAPEAVTKTVETEPPPASPIRDVSSLPDLSVFRDRSGTPELVILPAGSFLMGTSGKPYSGGFLGLFPSGEGGADERPQHRVTIGYRFAVGRYPVSFEEYDRFADSTGAERPGDEGWGRGRRPVINVSWHDAQAYVRWLSEITSQTYRLLSEAEWEYAARAGTTTKYWWGDEISSDKANYGGGHGKTTPVGSYAANPWKLFDVHGNVWEWVEDCWNDSYRGAPLDGSAWTTGDCSRRVLRGGSWLSTPGILRAAARDWFYPSDRYGNLGFRIARTT